MEPVADAPTTTHHSHLCDFGHQTGCSRFLSHLAVYMCVLANIKQHTQEDVSKTNCGCHLTALGTILQGWEAVIQGASTQHGEHEMDLSLELPHTCSHRFERFRTKRAAGRRWQTWIGRSCQQITINNSTAITATRPSHQSIAT